ncbi:ABC transporter ATP-binding protein [Nonomuraea africana]|uniref:ATP-binding cassette subfamily B protein n=1 Tax=Nonomuraea africana TaxID=46171 RepID=A0ABR9K7M6_9ACTN|nr:ABC transporter ATP-binding protein [Nonomuraea africana]MBE1557773.1 ATP-binding cassette subfamily B protein [Nonomuraea africana]
MRRLLVAQWPLLALSALCGLVSVALVVAGPLLLGAATDLVVAGAPAELPAALGVTLAVYVVSGLFWAAQGRVTTLVVQRAALRLRADVEEKLARLPVAYVDGMPRGELLSRATNDIEAVTLTLQQSVSQIVNSMLIVVGTLVMMVGISPLLALVAVVTVPVSVAVSAAIGRRARPHFTRQGRVTGELGAHVEEMYTGHALVRAFGRQDESAAVFHARNQELFEAGSRAQFVSGLIQPALMFVANLGYVVVAVAGGLRVASGALTIGEVQAFVQYARYFGGPLSNVASLSALVQSGLASSARIAELLAAPEEPPEPSHPVRPSARGHVVFHDVSFGYATGPPVIEHLSLEVRPGQRAAVVGPTGAGKTTLVNLLMRFHELTGGRITVDGVDLTAMSRACLRSVVGMVPQDTWLFGGTITDNIAYGAAHATRQQVARAARLACVDWPLDTVLDEDGGGLSAGERQLIAIARAFVADPAVLVLDEATSSVDTRTEARVLRAMRQLSEGRTCFVIAHRPSAISDADVVITMATGEQREIDPRIGAGDA